MTIADDLLRAVLADPDDDDARLVFADWYDAEGRGARAELIRVQVELARLDPTDRRAHALSDRAAALLARHGAAFRAELPALAGITWDAFERGFVSTVRADRVATLLHHADALPRFAPVHTADLTPAETTLPLSPPRAVPWLRTLRISGSRRGPWLGLQDAEVETIRALLPNVTAFELADLEAEDLVATGLVDGADLSRCRSVRVSGNHTAGRPFAAQVAHLPLTELRLGTDFENFDSGYFQDPTVGASGAAALAGSAALNGLSVLDLDLQQIDDAGWAAVAGAFPRLKSLSARWGRIRELVPPSGGDALRELRLTGNPFGDAGARALSRSPRCHALEALDLDSCEISADGLREIVSCPAWATLRELRLGRNPLAGAGAVFAGAPAPGALHTLDLADADLTQADVEALAALGWVRSCWALDLSANAVGAALRGLAGSEIARWSLRETGMDAETLRTLAPTLRRAGALDLSGNPASEALPALLDGVVHAEELRLQSLDVLRLPGATQAPALWRLSLRGTPLGGGGLAALLGSPLLRGVIELDLAACALADPDMEALMAWDGLERLQVLDLRDNDAVRPATIVALARALPRTMRSFVSPSNYWRLLPAHRHEVLEILGPIWARDGV